MKLTAAEINEAERVMLAIIEECDLDEIVIRKGEHEPGLINKEYRQRMNERAEEAPF